MSAEGRKSFSGHLELGPPSKQDIAPPADFLTRLMMLRGFDETFSHPVEVLPIVNGTTPQHAQVVSLHNAARAQLKLDYGIPGGSFDPNRASEILLSKATAESRGVCAYDVRTALMSSGAYLPTWPGSAYQYATDGYLTRAGFDEVASTSLGSQNYTPRVGDVIVVQPIPGHSHGHICMVAKGNDGHLTLVSDFDQGNKVGYRGVTMGDFMNGNTKGLNIAVFRHKDQANPNANLAANTADRPDHMVQHRSSSTGVGNLNVNHTPTPPSASMAS